MSDHGLDTERLRRTFVSDRAAHHASGDCPAPAAFWSAVTGGLPAAESRRLGLQALSCGACRREWALARELASGAALPGEGDAVGQEPGERARRRAPAWWLLGGSVALAAAAVLVLLAIPSSLQRDDSFTTPRLRSGGQAGIRSVVPVERALPRDGFVLRWEGPEDARYDLRVSDESLEVIHRARDLAATEYRVPLEALVSLPPGATILWQVEAILPGGGRLPSVTFEATLK